MWLNGADLRPLPLTERRQRLQDILPKGSAIITEALSVTGTGRKLFELICAKDFEGIVAKRLTDAYRPRTRWLKIENPRALSSGAPDLITLVAMGDTGTARATEDELCALHMHNQLEGRPGDPDAVRRMILAGKEAARFQDPARTHIPEQDLEVALDIDRYDFAIRVALQNGSPVARIEKAI